MEAADPCCSLSVSILPLLSLLSLAKDLKKKKHLSSRFYFIHLSLYSLYSFQAIDSLLSTKVTNSSWVFRLRKERITFNGFILSVNIKWHRAAVFLLPWWQYQEFMFRIWGFLTYPLLCLATSSGIFGSKRMSLYLRSPNVVVLAWTCVSSANFLLYTLS